MKIIRVRGQVDVCRRCAKTTEAHYVADPDGAEERGPFCEGCAAEVAESE